ncbi:TPR repeat protein [Psychrobacter sp. PL19]|uniref:tetratricopeptide repeat protein n=1 Tax=Psychrobacter sp. PL19 TaxID=2760711 RepID=UPI001AE34C41
MFRNPTNKNYLEAQTLIGLDYLNGNGIAQDYAKALEWFEKAASEDYPTAQNMLGAMFKNGHGVQQDYEQAFEWFEKAATQDYDEGQTNLALAYAGGVSNLENYAKAFEWMQKAAKQGHAIAQYFMGEMFRDKDFVDQPNSIEAFEWYQRAANQGLPDAQACIAEMYKQGEGVGQDDKKAFEWYQKAADQGHVETPEWFQELLDEKDKATSNRTEQIENHIGHPNSSNELIIPLREFFDSYFRDESKRVPQSPGGGVLFFESMSSDEISKFGDKAYDIRQKTNYEADILNADLMIDTSLVVKNYGTGLFLHLYEHSYRLHLKNYAEDWKIVDDIKSTYYDKANKVLIINGYKVSLISKSSCLYGERLADCINAYMEQNSEQKINQEIVSNSKLVTDALDNIDNRLAEIEEKLALLQYDAAA